MAECGLVKVAEYDSLVPDLFSFPQAIFFGLCCVLAMSRMADGNSDLIINSFLKNILKIEHRHTAGDA
jgi:hypothetical protein